MAKENKLIEVRSNYPIKKDKGSQIALNETDPRHPNGHAFVASPTKWVKVYPTAKVRELQTKNILIEKGSNADEDFPVVDMTPNVAPAADLEEETEEVAELETVELQEGDTPETLAERYERPTLVRFAKEKEIAHAQNASAKVIAEKILSAA